MVIYHNITPAHFFLGFHPHLAGLCHHGRRELAAFAARTELALGDSEFNRQELEQAGFARTAVLPIVLDLSLYERPPSPVVRRLYDDGRTNVLFVGRIIPNKKIDDLVRSFAVFQKWVKPHSRLLLVGDHRGFERYFDRLQELVRELRVDEVVFTGQVDDDELYAYYRLADVFLCLSEHEGFGVPLQEAMHFGLPVDRLRRGRRARDAARRRAAAAGQEPGARGRGARPRHARRRPAARARRLAEARDRGDPRHRLRGARSAGWGPRRMSRARPSALGAGSVAGAMRIDQWVPALHRGDAIGDSARLMRDAFRSWGHTADVYALELDADLAGDGRRFADWRPGGPRTS